MKRLLILSVLSAFVCICTAQSPCIFENTRIKTGFSLSCKCPTGKAVFSLDATVDVTASCLESCLAPLAVACYSGDVHLFRSRAVNMRKECCSQCGGTYTDKVCQRNILEGRPLVIPPSTGCFHKVRGTTLGQNYACRCADGKDFEVAFFLATGTDEDCLDLCGESELEKKCKLKKTEESMTKKFGNTFRTCCQSCGGKPITSSRTGLQTCALKKSFS